MTQIAQKDRLLSLQAELKQRIEKIAADLSHRHTSPKFSEQVVDRQNDDVLYNLKAEAEAELVQIEKALLKLERNLYGQCETCHEAISAERLAALPFTAFCKRCAA
jgi:RNA polymerase-binding transcription factor DksA